MNRHCTYSWLPALALLCSLPGFTATIYKSIDDNGVVKFSDTRPADDILVETVVIEEQFSPPSGQEQQQRLQDMRETTDRMVADRMAREKHRAELRQLETKQDAQQTPQNIPDDNNTSPIYTGYRNYTIPRPWWPPHYPRPEYPLVHPPLLPPVEERPPNIRPLPGNDYPGSLIRRYYDPKVREAYR